MTNIMTPIFNKEQILRALLTQSDQVSKLLRAEINQLKIENEELKERLAELLESGEVGL